MNPSVELMRDAWHKADTMRREELNQAFVNLTVLCAAIDVWIHRRLIGERSLVADARLSCGPHVGDCFTNEQAMRIVWGDDPDIEKALADYSR